VHRLLRSFRKPQGRAHRLQRGRPFCAQPARAEMRLGLATAVAPRRAHRLPAVTADGADEALAVARAQQGVTQETLCRENKLF